ncbi:MAG: hypothetical protein NTW21_19275 [Verrucomicrobia bacterium]|nr:hypothetical protein [Verrucomicrobiota bacterium]
MSHQFQIQDIVAQDLSGVTFHALDATTGQVVELRRFFPFGVHGGGLLEDERAAYEIAVTRLAGLKHAGLRAVLTGGCDPVDGMPFVVTEWLEGESLEQRLAHGVLAPAAAIEVLDRALELSEALSQVLGEQALWVETAPAMIVWHAAEPGRRFTFCISPQQWLGGDASRRSLLPVVELAEDLLGWRGRVVADQAGTGLGSWVKWLRANAETIPLSEARKRLASATGGVAPEPVRPMIQPVSLPESLEKPSSARSLVVIGVLALSVAGAGWYLLRHPAASRALPPVAAAPAVPLNAAGKRLAEVNAQAAALARGTQQQPATVTEASKVFQVRDSPQLMQEKDREVTVEGVLVFVRSSHAGKRLYLEFSPNATHAEVAAFCMTREVGADMSLEALEPLIGKRLRITGVVTIGMVDKIARPELRLKDRNSIKELE